MNERSRPTNRLLHPEMIVGISAVFIGLCALAVSLYEAKLMREEQRSAVLPILELSRSYYINEAESPDARWRLKLQAENVGIGPARIQNFRVLVDGQAQATWAAAMGALLNSDTPVSYGQSSINGRTIPPDRMVTMFDLADTALTGELVGQFDRLDFEACYCSVFDECWTTRYTTFGAAESVAACSRNGDSFDE